MGYAAQTKGEQDGRKLEGKITEREMERREEKTKQKKRWKIHETQKQRQRVRDSQIDT